MSGLLWWLLHAIHSHDRSECDRTCEVETEDGNFVLLTCRRCGRTFNGGRVLRIADFS